ncbi:MAG: hypothetical protein QOK09_4190, partial [Mycobacterium sp.]|nr:hypothetical protein [Mycobacterium sp.]
MTIHIGQGGAPMDLMMQVGDTDGQFICQFQYNTDLFDDATIERMAGHFETLLDGIVADPGRRLSELPLLTETERRAQAAWSDTQVCYDAPDCLHEMVAATARRSPHAIAISFADDELTYAELDRRAEQAAGLLITAGAKPGDRIAWLGRSHEAFFEIFFGAARARVCLAPINARLAVPEIAFILKDSGADLFFVTPSFFEAAQAVVSLVDRPIRLIGVGADCEGFDSYETLRDAAPAAPAAAPEATDDVL